MALSTFCTLIFNDINDLTFVNRMLYESSSEDGLHLLSIFSWFNDEQLWIPKVICLFILFLVIIGWRPRYTGILHWWVAASFMISNAIVSGGDQIAANISLFLIPYTLLDSRKWHWRTNVTGKSHYSPYKNIIGNFVICLVILQVSIIYLDASITKMAQEEWKNGTALYYWFDNEVFGAPNYVNWIIKPVISNEIVLPIMTHGVMIFELLLFAGIFATKRIRRILLKTGIVFHIGIIIVHGIFGFAIVMFGALIMFLAYDMDLKLTKRIRRFGRFLSAQIEVNLRKSI